MVEKSNFMLVMQEILSALQWRYATKVFDPAQQVSNEDFHCILESARLSPSSLGIEPWRFLVIENPDVRVKLREVSYDQPKVTDADRLVVVAQVTNGRETLLPELLQRTAAQQGVAEASLGGLRDMVMSALAGRDDATLDAWLRAQCYIPLGIMVATASLLRIDHCPMEGFDARGVDAVLGLPEKHLHAVTMIAFGGRGNDSAATRPKVRRLFDDVVMVVR